MARLKYYSKKTNAWETVDSTFGTGNVKTVNGVEPDANGNIEIGIPEMPEINYPVTSVNGMTGDVVIEAGSGQNAVQANWGQNDPESLDYVKGRTHWEENNQTVIEWDGDTEGRDSIVAGTGVFYKVSDFTPTRADLIGCTAVANTGDSTTFTADMLVDGINCVFLYQLGFVAFAAGEISDGNDSLMVPSAGVYFLDIGGEYLSSITYGSTVVHQLDEKFIPDSIARKTDIPKLDATLTKSGAAADAAAVGAAIERIAGQNPVQSDLSQNDPTQPDYVKHRTHWEENNQTVIEWDGSTEGRDSFTANWLVDNTSYYKVSDIVPAADDLVGGSIGAVYEGEFGQIPIESIEMFKQGNGAYSFEGMIVFVQNTTFDFADASINNGADIITAPNCGVYIVDRSMVEITSLTYGSTVVHPLDEKWIPDSVARVEDMTWENLPDKPFGDNQTVIEWDGNTEGRGSVVLGSGTFVKVSDMTPDTTELTGANLRMSMGGQEMENPIADVQNGGGCYLAEGVVLVVQRTDITFGEFSAVAPSTGVYFMSIDAALSLTYGSTKTVDEKFIPDTIARKSDIPAAPVTSVNGMTGDVVIEIGSGSGSPVQADLSQNNENAADYVKNRTHWKEETTEILFSETNIDFSDTVSRPPSFQLDEGAYIVTIDGEAYYYELSTYNGTNYIGDIQGNPIVVYVEEGDLLMAMANGGVHSIEIYRDKTIYHKLDSRYIDAVQEFIIPVDFNNATLTDSATSGHFAGTQRYKVAIETPYYEIVKEYSAGKHLIVRLDNMGFQSYFFTLVSTDGTSFRFESTFIMSANTTRITNLYLELGQQSIGSDTAKVFLQTTTIETNMPPEPASAIADLTAAPTAEDFNALLAALRAAGYLATE